MAVKARGILTWELATGCSLGLRELSASNSATCCLRASSAQHIVAGQQQWSEASQAPPGTTNLTADEKSPEMAPDCPS